MIILRQIFKGEFSSSPAGAAVAEWLSSWLAEQEDRGSIPGLATWIFRDWLSPASKSRYGWKIAKSTLILKKQTNKQTSSSPASSVGRGSDYKYQEDASSSPIVGKNLSFCIFSAFSLSMHALQVKWNPAWHLNIRGNRCIERMIRKMKKWRRY